MQEQWQFVQLGVVICVIAAGVCFKDMTIDRWFDRENAWGLLLLGVAALMPVAFFDFPTFWNASEHIDAPIAVITKLSGARSAESDARTGYVILLASQPVAWVTAVSPNDAHFDRLAKGERVGVDYTMPDRRLRALQIEDGVDRGWSWREPYPFGTHTLVLGVAAAVCIAGSLYILIAGQNLRRRGNAAFIHYDEIGS